MKLEMILEMNKRNSINMWRVGSEAWMQTATRLLHGMQTASLYVCGEVDLRDNLRLNLLKNYYHIHSTEGEDEHIDQKGNIST